MYMADYIICTVETTFPYQGLGEKEIKQKAESYIIFRS